MENNSTPEQIDEEWRTWMSPSSFWNLLCKKKEKKKKTAIIGTMQAATLANSKANWSSISLLANMIRGQDIQDADRCLLIWVIRFLLKGTFPAEANDVKATAMLQWVLFFLFLYICYFLLQYFLFFLDSLWNCVWMRTISGQAYIILYLLTAATLKVLRTLKP